MLNELRQRVATALNGAHSPGVLFSGGKDSLLLAALVREQRPDFTLIWFRTGESDSFVRRIIHSWQPLTCVSWNPADVYLLAENGERALVQEYDFGGVRFPVITDLAPGTRCSRILPMLAPQVYPTFDVLLWGARDEDQHWIKGSASFPPDGVEFGTAKVYAPLRAMTTTQVLAGIAELGLAYEPQPDSLPMCSACMETDGEVHCPELNRMIPAIQADWAAGLAAFRTNHHLEA